jgi:ABC-type cobalamin/Fe3+-siderophores transport system ATPase subunit
MKFTRIRIEGFKNVRSCDVDFSASPMISAVIGSNGSGKSNLIEAIVHILIGFYFGKPPRFDFSVEFVAQNRAVVLQRQGRRASVLVDGAPMPLEHFARRLHDGPAQVFYPELTLVYYSGECRRVQKLVARYTRHFQEITRKPETDRFRPLFVQSSNDQSQIILLALYAHGHYELLDRLELRAVVDVNVVLRSPEGFDPDRHEPKLWNTEGSIRRIVAAFEETGIAQETYRNPDVVNGAPASNEQSDKRRSVVERMYSLDDDGIRALAKRLEGSGDNLYIALEGLRARGMLRSIDFRIVGREAQEAFPFDQLSEGEKQLLAVVGAIQLANQTDNLVLLDEPDTHLNPHWSWDYTSMLTEALKPEQRPRSTVLMATHDPVMISGMVKEQVLLAHRPTPGQTAFTRPVRNPRGQGVANLLCSSEFFGLPSSLDKETQKLLNERLAISVKEQLSDGEKARLKTLNEQLEILPGVSERDPDYVAFLRQRHGEAKP